MLGAFRSLRSYNYRVWAAGGLVSNVGTWMQRTAQDWLVLTELTQKNATAVGIVMALQFGPQLLLLPLTGYAADHFDRRKLLSLTQGLMGALALGLGLLTLMGWVKLWHVYVFAGLLGAVAAFDAPARQTFVSELAGEDDLSNAVALNSTSFNAARMIGPAVAGGLLATMSSGWVFLLNALSYIAVLISLGMLRPAQFFPRHRPAQRGGLLEGFRYVWHRHDLRAVLLMLFLIGTFGLNFPIFISAMVVKAYQGGADKYGLLTSVMAAGSVAGALFAAQQMRPRLGYLIAGSLGFGVGCMLAAVMPTYVWFGVMLVAVGMAAQMYTTSTNSLVQLSTEPAMRGRVIAIQFAIALGGTPLGAPLVGWVADTLGPRWSLLLGALSGFAAVVVGLRYLVRYRGLRVVTIDGRRRFSVSLAPPGQDAETPERGTAA
jgi:MFS family permease